MWKIGNSFKVYIKNIYIKTQTERPQQSESSDPQNTVNEKRDLARTASSSYKTVESTPPGTDVSVSSVVCSVEMTCMWLSGAVG